MVIKIKKQAIKFKLQLIYSLTREGRSNSNNKLTKRKIKMIILLMKKAKCHRISKNLLVLNKINRTKIIIIMKYLFKSMSKLNR